MSLSMHARMIATDAAKPPERRMHPLRASAWRYGLSVSGPVAVSGAHFLASLLFVRTLPPAAFGLFSFVLVIVPFVMSMTAALLVVPVTRALESPREIREAIVASCLKMNLLLSAASVFLIFGLLLAAHGAALPALLLSLFGGVFSFRWFARCHAFVDGDASRAIGSDLAYAAVLLCGLGFFASAGHADLTKGAVLLLLAALLALVPLSGKFLAEHYTTLAKGSLRRYRATFRELAQWSLLGVIFTELTVNAHAYLVTFIAGPGSFALLALGMLLMRPASLVQSALPDLERPVMTRQIGARDWGALDRTTNTFGLVLFAVLLGTLVLDGALLAWLPGLVLKKGYSLADVVAVTALSALIMSVRALRAPPALLLQAAGAFKELARLGLRSSAVSLIATFLLLIAFGPIASLGGVLLGELLILFACRKLVRDWEARRA